MVHEVQWSAWFTVSEVQPGAWRGYWLLCLVHSLTERGEMVDKGLPLRILSMVLGSVV